LGPYGLSWILLRMENQNKEKKKWHTIRVDDELVQLLEKHRNNIMKYGWEAIYVNWPDLTRSFARKVKAANIIK
jgi:hypothetical protein